VAALGRRVAREGLAITGIPTSRATAAQAEGLGMALGDLGSHPAIDLTIDGADAVDLASFALIKGLGGALLREKIVASASRRMVVIVDPSKLVGRFDGTTPIPVEVVEFGWQATRRSLEALGCTARLRVNGDEAPRRTDNGNLTLDCRFAAVDDAARLAAAIKGIVGVVESGLFIGLASAVVVGEPGGGARVVTPP
jgi:ribose 5-phosphate isomerase A